MAVLIRHLGFWSLNGCRVLYSVGGLDDVARFGFAYGTLTNHAESGEELFEVFIDPQTDEVIYRIRAISWPQATLARVGQPIVRVLQERFREQSAAAMKHATRCNECSGMSIYVEILIRAPMDALWAHTQTPVLAREMGSSVLAHRLPAESA